MVTTRELASLVTLVVPARGRLESTTSLLDSLCEAGAEYRIVLVDDASNPPIVALPRHAALRLELVHRAHQGGPAVARNQGTSLATTPFVAFTDNDVVVTPGWMESLIDHLLAAPPDVAGVGGRVVHLEPSAVGEYATRLRLLDPYAYKGRVVYLVTANCVFRRAALARVNGFDETFRAPGGEDPDLSFRLIRAGYRLEIEPRALVRHAYSPSWLAFARMFFRYGRGCRRAMGSLQEPMAPGGQ